MCYYEGLRLWGAQGLTELRHGVGHLKKDFACVGGSELRSYELRSELEVELGSCEFK